MNDPLNVLCRRSNQIHDVSALNLFLLQTRQLLTVLRNQLFLFLNSNALFLKQSLLFFGFLGSHLPSLLNLFLPLLLGLGQTYPVLLLFLLHSVQLGVLRPQLLQLLLLVALFSLSFKHELPVLILPLSEDLLGEETVSLPLLFFCLDPPVHLRLLLLHLIELVLNVLVFTLRCQLLLLDFQLMGKHLVLTPRFGSLLLPALHAFALSVEDLLVQRVELLAGLPPMLLLLLLLELLK